MPGTTPDYWMTADDRTTRTVLDLLNGKTAAAGKRARKRGGRRG